MSPRGRAWRNRGVSLGAVLALVVGYRAGEPDPAARSTALYVTVIALGYGHLIGGAWFARRRIAASTPLRWRGPLGAAFVATSVGLALLLYLEAALRSSAVLIPLLALSVWHAFENDQALETLYAHDRVPRVARRGREHARAVALSLVAVAVFGASLGGRLPFEPAELFAFGTLYHVVSWLLFSLERGQQPARVIAVHAVPAAACAALLQAPLTWEHPLRIAAFAPSVYLFWATLHVAQTLWVRGRAAPQP